MQNGIDIAANLKLAFQNNLHIQQLNGSSTERKTSEKISNIKFHQNPSGGRTVPCGRTDMMKLIVAFRTFSNAPNNDDFSEHRKTLALSTGSSVSSVNWEIHFILYIHIYIYMRLSLAGV